MGIEVAWVDERHQVKQLVADSKQILSRLAVSRWPKLSSSVCLRLVDVCGDAVFNQAQIPVLMRELRSEADTCGNEAVRDHLEKVMRLAERALDKTHTYIVFIGE